METIEDNLKIPYKPNLFAEDEVLYSSPGDWMHMKRNNNYYYAERKGIDSVAFVLFDTNLDDTKRIGLLNEYKNPIHKNVLGAFGGSIDHTKYFEDLRILVQDEVLEEAGFKVELDQIKHYGEFVVCTHMNQVSYLFGVTVDKKLQQERTTTNPEELKSEVIWVDMPKVLELSDWKSFLIITKRMIAANAKITVKPIIK